MHKHLKATCSDTKNKDTICRIVSLFAALYPSFAPPKFAGPFNVPVTYMGANATDFTFTCTVLYRGGNGAMFDVVLTFDGEPDESTLKTTTAADKTVTFTSADLQGHMGTDVSKVFYFKIHIIVAVIVSCIIIILYSITCELDKNGHCALSVNVKN